MELDMDQMELLKSVRAVINDVLTNDDYISLWDWLENQQDNSILWHYARIEKELLGSDELERAIIQQLEEDDEPDIMLMSKEKKLREED